MIEDGKINYQMHAYTDASISNLKANMLTKLWFFKSGCVQEK